MRRKRSGRLEYTFWGKGTLNVCPLVTEYVLSKLGSTSGLILTKNVIELYSCSMLLTVRAAHNAPPYILHLSVFCIRVF